VTTFRFRAQAALDLRARALADAQRELARAEGVRDAARLRVTAADTAIAGAREQAAEAQRTAATVAGHEWYRFWILRLVHERTAHAATLAAREEDVTRAAAACLRAHQRREALDRFKDKARAAHDAAQQAAEMKLIDELATRRFAGRAFDDSHAAR
jgi:flagellar export protein FliJ